MSLNTLDYALISLVFGGLFQIFSPVPGGNMKVDVQFVNFPKSDLIRTTVLDKISDYVEKYIHEMTASVKVFFSLEGSESHIKIAFTSKHTDICVNAQANDTAHAMDHVLDKLDSALRKESTKRKQKRSDLPPHISEASDFNATNLRSKKRSVQEVENVFDKYEINYISDFEDEVR